MALRLYRKESVVAIVPKNELHPKLLAAVKDVLSKRQDRQGRAGMGLAFGGVVAGTPLALFTVSRYGAGAQRLAAVGLTVLPIIGAAAIGNLIGYKAGTRQVRRATQWVGRFAAAVPIDASGKVLFDPSKHVGIVNGNGSVTILQKTRPQAWLQWLQQQKVLGEAAPGRFRFGKP